MSRKRDDDPASRPDDDNPEWTRGDFRSARPALEVIGEVFGQDAADVLRRRPGRPSKPDRKVNQTLRLDADVLDAYRRQGQGWQARINQALREHMPPHLHLFIHVWRYGGAGARREMPPGEPAASDYHRVSM